MPTAVTPTGVEHLHLGRPTQRTCSTVHRRAFLQAGGSTILGLSLADLLRAKAAGQNPGSARAVVLLWLWGGPSQLDTFDPKPNAPLEYRGPFAPIPTRIPGVRFAELFPLLAGQSDKLAVVRTLTTPSSDHGVAGTIGLTGSPAGGTGLDGKPLPGSPRPALGSIVAKSLGGGREGRPVLRPLPLRERAAARSAAGEGSSHVPAPPPAAGGHPPPPTVGGGGRDTRP
ncbi:MAG: DUF1501 domain-containing protein, partial [Gemmataceae bacterium]|nr:DUF1501 domain-containing protein [Gemmataceae bacterium]